mmetsp:Transcript_17989/g.34615  ORF Transcript_17989/g.34615 Transcript_17989/m.34615 type:complete len:327 (-) Transcript_17989:138-1118(-)
MATRSLLVAIMFALLAKLSSSALLRRHVQGRNPGREALVSTAKAITGEDSEDGVESAEAAVEEAEKEASKQEAVTEASEGVVDSTEQVVLGQPLVPNVTKKVMATEATKADKATPISAAIQTSKPKLSKNVSHALAKKSVCGPRTIRLKIKGATGLKGEDARTRGMTDPYCVCEVQGKPRTKVQTMALDGFHGVHWDHDGEIVDFLAQDAITCSVYDMDALASDPDYFLGRTTLVGTKLLSQGFKGELHLKDAGAPSAVLKLEVMPLALDGEAAAEDLQEMAKAGCEDKASKSDKDKNSKSDKDKGSESGKDKDDDADEDDSESDD